MTDAETIAKLREEVAWLGDNISREETRANEAEHELERLRARSYSGVLAAAVHDYIRTVPPIADEPWCVAEHSYRVGLLKLLADALGEE